MFIDFFCTDSCRISPKETFLSEDATNARKKMKLDDFGEDAKQVSSNTTKGLLRFITAVMFCTLNL